MHALHRLDGPAVAALPWRVFRSFYRALLWRPGSAWGIWVQRRLEAGPTGEGGTPNDVRRVDDTAGSLLAAFGLPSSGIGAA